MHVPDPFQTQQQPQPPATPQAPPRAAGESGRYAGPGQVAQPPPRVQNVPSSGSHPGLIAMVIGGAIMLARIYFMSARSQAGQNSASQFLGEYNTMFEMAAGAFILAWGLSRHLSARNSVSGEAEANVVGQVIPFTIALTIAGLLIGSALN